MDVQVFKNFNEELKYLWHNFEVNANLLVFQSYEWQRYWYEQIGHPEYDISICVTVVSVKNEVRAIIPLGIRKAFGARVLEFIGADQADYSAPLIANDMSAVEFTKIWARTLRVIPPYDAIYFRNIPKLIGKSDNFLLGNINSKKVGSSFSATLSNSVDAHFSMLSKRMLKDNKRMIRKLSEMGELKFKILEDHTDFNKTLAIGISQKSNRYDSTGNRNIYRNKSIKSFFTNIYDLKKKGINIHLSALILDDEILATHLGILFGKCFYYLSPTFNHDSKWKKYSLGRIHLEKLTEWAINNKVDKFDFTIGAEEYKQLWCNNEMDIYRHFKIRSVRGIGFYIYHIVIELVKGNDLLKTLAVKVLNVSHNIRKN